MKKCSIPHCTTFYYRSQAHSFYQKWIHDITSAAGNVWYINNKHNKKGKFPEWISFFLRNEACRNMKGEWIRRVAFFGNVCIVHSLNWAVGMHTQRKKVRKFTLVQLGNSQMPKILFTTQYCWTVCYAMDHILFYCTVLLRFSLFVVA